MDAATALEMMSKHNLKVNPVLEPAAKGKTRLVHWCAGRVSIAHDKWTNIVLFDENATGATPAEAIQALCAKLGLA